MTFRVTHIETGARYTVYAVHKSGPANTGRQTKFLVFKDGEWEWVPASFLLLCDQARRHSIE